MAKQKQNINHHHDSRSSSVSKGVYPAGALSNVQTAFLQEKIKDIDLDNLCHQLEGDSNTDLEHRQV